MSRSHLFLCLETDDPYICRDQVSLLKTGCQELWLLFREVQIRVKVIQVFLCDLVVKTTICSWINRDIVFRGDRFGRGLLWRNKIFICWRHRDKMIIWMRTDLIAERSLAMICVFGRGIDTSFICLNKQSSAWLRCSLLTIRRSKMKVAFLSWN